MLVLHLKLLVLLLLHLKFLVLHLKTDGVAGVARAGLEVADVVSAALEVAGAALEVSW